MIKKLKQYLCYNNYLATGEGNHLWLSLEYAANKKSAGIKFQERFKLDDYFIIGNEILLASDKKVKTLLNFYFSENIARYFLTMIENSTGDFEFKFDCNFS